MNRGKEPILSNLEKDFILEAIRESKRLDGREVYDYRRFQITPGKEPGHVEVQLGGTRVLGCVSCEVIQPQLHRPTEGQLFFNVELSPMASPAFEVGRSSSQGTEIGRILERCFKESRAVDTESLCIIAGEKVWSIRIDLHVLDHCGNIIDCAAVAAITALKHFRHPDVTVIGEEATIHPVTERDPVPLSVHHMPLCVTFAFFWEGLYLLVDPTHSEEAVMDGRLVVGMNIHREICALQMAGGVAILPEQVLRCSQIAAVKCAEITEIIKSALAGTQPDANEASSILSTSKARGELVVPEIPMEEEHELREGQEEEMEEESSQVVRLGKGTAELGSGGQSTWEVEGDADGGWGRVEEGEEKRDEVEGTSDHMKTDNGSASEEETTVVVTEKDITGVNRLQEEPQPIPEGQEQGKDDTDLKPAALKKGKRGRRQPQGKKTTVELQTSTRQTGRRKRGKH